MDIFVELLRSTVLIFLDVLELALLLRAIFSWIDPMAEGRFSSFLYVVTEPFIHQVRRLFDARHWFEGIPLDIPFLVVVLLVSLLQTLIRIL